MYKKFKLRSLYCLLALYMSNSGLGDLASGLEFFETGEGYDLVRLIGGVVELGLSVSFGIGAWKEKGPFVNIGEDQ